MHLRVTKADVRRAKVRYGVGSLSLSYRKHGRSRVENNGGSIPPLIS